MIGLGLALLSNAALALGLGEIRVKSQPGQPLLAEIPVISSEPGELEQLRARLASPVTFERVGLPRPEGLVNELDFAIALDDAGRPVVRVTSRTPVDVPAVNFLIEVDWGQGRLVREYSALVSAPGTLAAAGQPVIDAPAAAPTDIIERPVGPVATASAELEPAPESTPQAAPDVPARPAPAPTPAAVATPSPSVAPGDTLAPVRRGQSLSQIAAPLAREQGYTLDQAMVALLRANPEAFINGNVNLLKQGAVLRVPESADAQTILESEAAALVRSQIAEWRSARAPIPQPAAVVEPVAPSAPASRAPAVAEARLEIAPAATSTTGSGTQSGVSAGGEGEMLANEQLQQSKEDLAAREAEVQELRSQVAELEKLKAQQEKLLAMKDSDLAAAQQRLAQGNGSEGGVPVWAWAGFGLLFVGALAWGFAQRRQRIAPAPVPRNPVFGHAPADSRAAELAAAMPQAATPEAELAPSPVLEPAVSVPVSAAPTSSPKPAPATGPTWHAGGGMAPAAPVTSPQAPAGRDRLELAVAYLDLGDVATARDLLNEVAAGHDATARDEALQLLREIG